MSQMCKTFGSFLQKSTNVLCNTSLITSNNIAVQTNTFLPSWSLTFIRTNIRNRFPRAKEGKRIKVHGWEKRLSTPGGQMIIMRRILKGRHVLSH
ncbi:CLUMA_CG011015, isoform A [Clunio marinus]|uniref:Large ribosomal subunit protein bL34m n=1 Tax=Clunio marinus TaxID=568069 RepID=A0A1J1IBH9_9DIPT|nr:CLUMA_CG011015, isoform A [Clunio marinus]